MYVYLAIAEVHVHLPTLIAIGALAGLLAGTFGVGGTFVAIPLLSLLGIPPAVAVSSSMTQMVASSATIAVTYWRQNLIDFRLSSFVFMGGIVGTICGNILFTYLTSTGQLYIAITLIYVFFLGGIATFMMQESIKSMLRKHRKTGYKKTSSSIHKILAMLPYKVPLSSCDAQVSALVPITLGFMSSMVIAIAGIGGGFLLIPSFIYILRVPTTAALATSNFSGFCTVIITAFVQASVTRTVDIVLAVILIMSSIFGSKIGIRLFKLIPPEELRLSLAIIMSLLIAKFLFQVLVTPANPFLFTIVR